MRCLALTIVVLRLVMLPFDCLISGIRCSNNSYFTVSSVLNDVLSDGCGCGVLALLCHRNFSDIGEVRLSSLMSFLVVNTISSFILCNFQRDCYVTSHGIRRSTCYFVVWCSSYQVGPVCYSLIPNCVYCWHDMLFWMLLLYFNSLYYLFEYSYAIHYFL